LFDHSIDQFRQTQFVNHTRDETQVIQVVTVVRRVFVQCLFPKCVIGYLQYKLFFTLGGVRNVGSRKANLQEPVL
jgi:hypothetical protein